MLKVGIGDRTLPAEFGTRSVVCTSSWTQQTGRVDELTIEGGRIDWKGDTADGCLTSHFDVGYTIDIANNRNSRAGTG